MRIEIAAFSLALLVVSAASYGGQRSVTVSSPEDLVAQLKSPKEEVRQQAASALRLSPLMTTRKLCADFEKVESQPATFRKGSSGMLIAARSFSACQALFLVPLLKVDDHWEALAPIVAIAHYNEPSFELKALISSGEQEVIVRDHDVDWGTGIQQWNMTIYKLVGEGMQIVFDQPVYSHFFQSNGDKVWEDFQRSRFSFVNGNNTAGVTSIRETRTETVGTRKMTVYRSYVWEPSAGVFRMLGEGPWPSQ